MLAYAVLEEGESTGGVIYARSAIAARREGANEYADGDFSYVTCHRAPWADAYHGKALDVGLMILHGWHFECSGCGGRIDEDMLDEKQIEPDDVIGHQHSAAYCDARCEAGAALEKAQAEHVQKRWLRRFAKIVKRRFPDAVPELKHAYAILRDGRHVIEQVTVSFDFPGRQHWPAELTWRRRRDYAGGYRRRAPQPHASNKPTWQCASGDREAFEAYAAATKVQPQEQPL
ncbi:hypothetical protein BES08_10820 [Novosphingobium resinovorum]|uniref:Uncharacterized protein n=2 Tax=Novosphingobium resinovorum TaxID=158500 RepID=A0A1D8A943_9SPHN|nr:hypothetical protein BES08_10820 [Novosphingobium resinovorum]